MRCLLLGLKSRSGGIAFIAGSRSYRHTIAQKGRARRRPCSWLTKSAGVEAALGGGFVGRPVRQGRSPK